MEKGISKFFKQVALAIVLLVSSTSLFGQAGVTFPNSTDVVLWERNNGAGGNLFNYANMKADIISGLSNGTVTSVGKTAANGFDLTITNPTTTPNITVSTTFTGIGYSNGTGFAAAVAANFPVLNQNTTGTAANITGVAAFANGGTGQTTQAAALTALAGTQTANYILASNGTTTALQAMTIAMLPTAIPNANLALPYIAINGSNRNLGTSVTLGLQEVTTQNASTNVASTYSGGLTSSGATSMSGGVTIGGGVTYTIGSQITANTTLVASDYFREINATSTITVSITTGLGIGKAFRLPLAQTSTGSVVIASTGVETFNGNANYTVGANSPNIKIYLEKTSATNYIVSATQ